MLEGKPLEYRLVLALTNAIRITENNMSYQPLAIYLQDKHSISDEFEFARYAEQRGFDAIWQADTRLARDCISMMGALAAITTRCQDWQWRVAVLAT